MAIKVNVGQLSYCTSNQSIIEVSGNTVRKCLKHVEEKLPELKLFDKNDTLLNCYSIYVNGVFAYPEELDKPIKDRDEISIAILQIMMGG